MLCLPVWSCGGGGQGTPYNFRLAIYNPAIFGRMGFRSVLSFLLNVWQQADPTYANKVVTEVVRGVKPDAEAAAAVGGGGKLSAITHGEWGTSQCSPTSAGLCVIGFLAGEPEQGSQKRHLDVLRQVAAAEASAPLRFLYVDGICFAGFAEAFDLQPPKLPTLAVYSAKKQRSVGEGGGLGGQACRLGGRSLRGGAVCGRCDYRSGLRRTSVRSRWRTCGASCGACCRAASPRHQCCTRQSWTSSVQSHQVGGCMEEDLGPASQPGSTYHNGCR